ncbi:hypothetical protein CLHOM_24390 [Clostridium homopropionicum DSM 5847]|uniref:RiboL-PSP-HEPN domain-containing protein n=1 Tax=Clostridium homopropionicum DSM 5847 TaxID=1121318 RepID=A0A0L6Z976_9CLOT|nr:hypothetical protein [Clostridium homopropionicum]KOA19333.1 hypothetical protein CLHOM_24390 [Clostridium homopropionicum DSM 5847]SFG21490.1 hypothetical protein SAMN04488501_106199 [Clostridium homopropionicum]
MNEDKQMYYFNNEKRFIADPIMYGFKAFYNLIDWAREDLYEWSNKTIKERRGSFSVGDILSYRGEVLEQCFNSAIVLNVYAILEDGLKRISEFYESNIQSNVEIEHFKFDLFEPNKLNSNIKKYASYLKAIGISIAKNENYQVLAKWTIIRNSIIHNGDEIIDEKRVKVIKDIVKIDYTLEEVSSYSFAIEFEALELFITTVEEYLISIFNYEIPSLKFEK